MVSTLEAFLCPESQAPRCGQVCAPGAVPEASLTMAKVKELWSHGVQPLLQMAWGQGPYCSHYLHPTNTRMGEPTVLQPQTDFPHATPGAQPQLPQYGLP